MPKRIITIIVFMGLSFQTVFSQNLNKAKLDSLFEILAKKDKAMGSLTVSKSGAVLYSRTIGYSSITGNEKKPATQNTKYRIGSVTKMFTATIIFQLIEEGKTSLETTLDAYFPQLPNAKIITIENLLNHRSGLHSFTSDSDYFNWMTQPKTKNEMLALIVKNGTDFKPDEKYAHSNTNYVVLGYIIEKITGESYSKVLTERITSKIGLSNTYAGGKINAVNDESFSYKFVTNGWTAEPETDMSIPGGAGCIVSNPADLDKFIEALFALKLVSAGSLEQMKTQTDGHGMGMFQVPFHKKRAFGHNGGIDGFESNLYYFPEDSLAVAYCTNGHAYSLNDVMIGVLSICFGTNYTIPTFNTLALNTGDLDKYLGLYSSLEMPLKITITKDNATLLVQATGQSPFALEATEKDKFRYDAAGIQLEFNPVKNEMILQQRGASYLFKKDK
jgi:D-alanyl-D-alanine carboxypeptidase